MIRPNSAHPKKSVQIVLPAPEPEEKLDLGQSRPKASERANFEHRHYFPLYPTCNKKLSMKWNERSQELHLQKIRSAKSTIDNAQPKQYSHLSSRTKKITQERGDLHS
jgi:hypothetical protein